MKPKVLEDYKNLEFIGISNGRCNYLQERQQHLYYFSKQELTAKEYRDLLDQGFRRSGNYIYRPFCNFCNECQIIRIPIHNFKRSKSQRRVWNTLLKIGFDFKIIKPVFSLKKLEIYIRYLEKVHPSTYQHFLEVNEVANKINFFKENQISAKLISKYPNYFKSFYETM